MQALLSSLVLLACPLGMGLMMRMGGGNAQSSKDQPAMSPEQQAELAQLRTELAQLRARAIRAAGPAGARLTVTAFGPGPRPTT